MPLTRRPTKFLDANGWTVYNYGTFFQYRKRLTFSQSVAANSAAAVTLSSNNLPTGMATLSDNHFNYSPKYGADSAQFIMNAEMTTASTTVVLGIKNTFSGALTPAGSVDILISSN